MVKLQENKLYYERTTLHVFVIHTLKYNTVDIRVMFMLVVRLCEACKTCSFTASSNKDITAGASRYELFLDH